MDKDLHKKLKLYKKRTISISELEEMVGRATRTYTAFAEQIVALEIDGFLEMIKSKGRNQRTPSIAYHYKINKSMLNKEHHYQLQQYRLVLNNAIDLDAYFNLDQLVWEKDLPYLEKINTFIEQCNFPLEKAPAPERSFELVGDEKWIGEQNGSEVLRRIGLWDRLCILPVSDPLMFAINPNHINQIKHLHLIVENKTTYQGLLPVITNTIFSTLIYGSGNKVPKSIENFSSQFPVQGEHVFFYFGDIDHSGITIWNSLNNRERVLPAYPFYLACLEKKKAYGKTNQHPNEKALSTFLNFFKEGEQKQIQALLAEGAYYPQEVLKTKELQHIWEAAEWKTLI